MMILQREEVYLHVKNNYDIILAILLSGLVTSFLTKKLRKSSDAIPGRLGLPLVGETLSFLSATNSAKGCYDFVRFRRQKYGKWFKTRLFGKVHVFVPSVAGAKAIFANDFQLFNKGYIKSMADAVGKNSLLCVPVKSHKRIRRLLSGPFSMDSLSKFVQKFDNMLSERFKKLADSGKSFVVLDFNMKIAFDAMCGMLMSITDESLLNKIEKDCTAISDAMLSIPVMIPGTRYYKGIKVVKCLTFHVFQLAINEPSRARLSSGSTRLQPDWLVYLN
ncbi:putative cytochrome P450 [Helianthus annuus]|uniref:Cytochrome P450 n=1 Tax=Helianthus annuus TaxID=4232 RepID=A0A251SA01_HELAN|nr:putative cytochrome P450 [Helianthus annuus]KAJ0451693.1 putative cytochrome P450 [Helianthus annuus]KAJ0456334.1 putative cytochrome P450 [Helianthus annuus]KAJ0473578.1 putative cytochrome P450 [Helianthus annuus]KAJ0649156.1 putative cytochrome P450 [Helianthus annuus]